MPLDIGMGILLALGVSELYGMPLTLFMVVFGIASALLPDIDIVTAAFGRWRHREVTHYPILYVPLFVLVFIFLPHEFALLFTLGVLAHFVHDTIGTGWGISWLWPFTPRRFLLFPDGERRRTMGTIATWLPEEKSEYAHSSTDHAWIRRLYGRPNPVAFVEYGLLALALIALSIYLYGT